MSINLFTPEYLDLCTEFEAVKKSGPTSLRGGKKYIYVTHYAKYIFCPFSLSEEQAKLPSRFRWLDEEEEKEAERQKQSTYAYGSGKHKEREDRIVREVPNAVVTAEILSTKNLALKQEVRTRVAPAVQAKIKKYPREKVTEELEEELEDEAIEKDELLSEETKATVKKLKKIERKLATSSTSVAIEQPLCLLHNGVWFSGRPDTLFFTEGKASKVDEFKSTTHLTGYRRHIAQIELYCLMLRRAIGQKDFSYTLSLNHQSKPLLFTNYLAGEWNESKVLANLDEVVDYFTGRKEAAFPEGFNSYKCEGCYSQSRCPKFLEARELLHAQDRVLNLENVRLWKLNHPPKPKKI